MAKVSMIYIYTYIYIYIYIYALVCETDRCATRIVVRGHCFALL